jgi:hypothetical protein
MTNFIYKTQFPTASLIEKSFTKFDYTDAYSCTFPSQQERSVDDAVQAFFKTESPVISSLFKLRNAIMKPFGFKASDASDREKALRKFKIEKGNALGLFKVIDRSDNEVIMGEDDRHLNFRISLLLTRDLQNPVSYTLVLSTAVTMNNQFGKLYFIPVKPMHKLIVPSMMKSIVSQLSSI